MVIFVFVGGFNGVRIGFGEVGDDLNFVYVM